MLESIISFHHYIEFLIFYEFNRRLFSNVFSLKISGNLQKTFVNNETLQKQITK